MIRVGTVSPEALRRASRFFLPLLKRACSRVGNVDAAKVLAEAQGPDQGRSVIVWMALDDEKQTPLAIVATRIVHRAGYRICWVICGGGARVDEWLQPIREAIEDHAQAERCEMILMGGRRGWTRLLGITPWKNDDGIWMYEAMVSNVH